MRGERPEQEVVDRQVERLEAHRATLHSYLLREARLGQAHAPPEIFHGIADARRGIAEIKARLRAWGVPVDDLPDDEEHAAHRQRPAAGRREGESARSVAGAAREYRPAQKARVEQGLFALLPLGVGLYGLAGLVQPDLIAVPVGPADPFVVLLVALGALAVGAGMLYDLYRRRDQVLRISPEALEYVGGGKVTTLLWRDVEKVWRSVSTSRYRSPRDPGPPQTIISPYILSDRRDVSFSLPPDLHPREEIEAEIRAWAGDHLLPAHREEYVLTGATSFGESLGLSRGGVRLGGATYAWTDVIEAGEEPRLVWVRVRGRAMRQEARMQAEPKMYNVFAFVELVNEMAGSGRPRR